MIRSRRLPVQANSGADVSVSGPTIEAIAHDTSELCAQLMAKEFIAPRELRRFWLERRRPFWRLHPALYRALARRLVELGENFVAIEVAQEGCDLFDNDPDLVLLQALASARSGATRQAQELLFRHEARLSELPEYRSLLGRTYKDLWKESGENRYLEQAFQSYMADYRAASGDRAFPGVNAATAALLLGREDEARRIAREVLMILADGQAEDYWTGVTGAECRLILGDLDGARGAYDRAAHGGKVPWAHLATTRAQARLILERAGHPGRMFDACFPMPAVACFSGHRIDEPGRTPPRFPESLVDAVERQIRDAVERFEIGFGFSSAANGSDLLFLEALQAAGRETTIILPLDEETFFESSVQNPASPRWAERFHEALQRATSVTSLGAGEAPEPMRFDYGNRVSLGAACQKAGELGTDLILLAVWNGEPGDGTGGTADFVRLAREAGRQVEIIPLPGSDKALEIAGKAGETEERILSILAFTLREGSEAAALAACLREEGLIHAETVDRRVRACFRTPEEAARAACKAKTDFGGSLEGALGLDAGPVVLRPNPLTGFATIEGGHAAKAAAFSCLEPAGQIYTTLGFASLASIPANREVSCEFLGRRPVEGEWEQVFRLEPPASRDRGREQGERA